MEKFYSKWMEKMWNIIADQRMRDIILPATHNSGAFSAANTIMVRCQDKIIRDQLNAGIRALDIRVKKNDNNILVMHHGSYPPDDSQYVVSALKQIRAFIEAHDKEILVIRLRTESEGVDKRDWGHNHLLRQTVLDYLKDFMVPKGVNYTPNKIYKLDGKKRIIVLSDIDTESDQNVRNLFWVRNKNTRDKYDSWDESQIGGDFEQTKVDQLQPRLVASFLANPGGDMMWASTELATINIYLTALHRLHPALKKWLGHWETRPDILKGMNIVSLDFYDVLGIHEKLIQLNRAKFPPLSNGGGGPE